jgi:Protein of unknown function (DUF669)
MAKEKKEKKGKGKKTAEQRLADDMDRGKEKSFSAEGYKPKDNSFEIMKSGEYVVSLVKAEAKKSSVNSDNRYVDCQFKITEGPNKGRVLFHKFNTVNASEQAVEIGINDLKQFMHSAKVLDLPGGMHNLSPLLGIPVACRIGVQKGDEQYEDRNVIKMFLVKEVESSESEDKPDKKGKKKDKGEKKDKGGKKGKGKKGKGEDAPF